MAEPAGRTDAGRATDAAGDDDPRLAFVYLSFRFDAQELLDEYVDADSPLTMSQMHRALALRAKADWQRNGQLVRRMREAVQAALVLLVLEILAWLFAIAQQPT